MNTIVGLRRCSTSTHFRAPPRDGSCPLCDNLGLFGHIPGSGPDPILLDINLPDMEGFEVRRQLRAGVETRDIPVIAVSANAMHSDIENGASAGFLDYLTKPIEVVRLVTSINAALAAGQ